MSYFKLVTYMLIRMVMNTSYRMIYPFVGVFGRGLGVGSEAILALIAKRSLIGTFTPFLIPFIETRGRKFGMLLGLSLFVLAMGLVAWYPSLTTLGIGLVLGLVAKGIFDPSLISYVADHTAYEKRGTAMGILEFGWSLAFIVGVYSVARMIERFTWYSPFWVMGALGLMAFAYIAFTLTDSEKPAHHESGRFGHVKAIFTSPTVLIAFSIGMLVSAANEVVNVMFGVWLEDSFRLQIAALAGASAIIGLSELGGEGLVAGFVDRVGKVRAAGIGIIANCLAAILLPIIGRTESGALVGLFLFYLTFEFTIVGIIPLMTEVMPSARATTLSFAGAGHGIGRAVGAFLAPILYVPGFSFLTGAAVIFNLLGLAAVWYVSNHHE